MLDPLQEQWSRISQPSYSKNNFKPWSVSRALMVAMHTQYTDVFGDIMTATKGEIVQYVRILPSSIKEQTKDLMLMNFRTEDYTIFSGFEHTRRLITNGIDTVRKGLEDFYTIGDALLMESTEATFWSATIDGKLLEKFLGTKRRGGLSWQTWRRILRLWRQMSCS
jgi:predicted HAD superfamily hydrolase